MQLVAIALAFGLAHAPAAPQPQEPPATALVMGRVTDAGSGRPVGGAIVSVSGPAAPSTLGGGSPSPPLRVMTDANGRFVIRGLKKGALLLGVIKSGYMPGSFGQHRPQGTSQPLQIEPGQRLTDVEIRMWRHGVIAGSVVDEAGEPVVNVAVSAFRRTFRAGRRRFTPSGQTARTDDRGMFRLSGVVPGEYAVAVTSTQIAVPTEAMDSVTAGNMRDPKAQELSREIYSIGSVITTGTTPNVIRLDNVTLNIPRDGPPPVPRPDSSLLVYPTMFFPASRTLAQATVIKVGSGEERGGIDLQLEPVKSVRVSGNLIGPEGPAGHVSVRLAPANDDDSIQEIETARTMTDANGAFTFLGVPAGSYLLKILRVPRPPVNLDDSNAMTITQGGGVTIGFSMPPAGAPTPPPVSTDATLHAVVPVAVGETDVSGVVVTLRSGPRVSGRLEFEGSAEKPPTRDLRTIVIQLDPADGALLGPELARSAGHPEEDGNFQTLGVPPGRYALHATSWGPWTMKSAMYEGHDISDTPIEINKDLSGVVLTFTDRMTRITGTVRDGQRLDDGAVVLAFPTDNSAWSGAGAQPRRMRNSRADKKGAYRLSMLPPGDYYLVAIKDEASVDWADPAQLEALSRVARQVHLGDGEEKTFDLKTVALR